MSTFESTLNLSSFRKCRDETIPRKVMGKILEAGRQAPSPGNVQSLEFIVVEDSHKKEMLSDAVSDKRVAEAPTAVIVIGDIERMKRRVGEQACHDCCNAEAACAVQNMRLTAAEEDIASCWMSGFDQQHVADQFGVPDGKKPLGVVAFCYTDDPVNPPQKFSMNNVCFYDHYDNQVGSVFDGFEFEGLKETSEIYGKKTKGLFDKLRRRLSKYL